MESDDWMSRNIVDIITEQNKSDFEINGISSNRSGISDERTVVGGTLATVEYYNRLECNE